MKSKVRSFQNLILSLDEDEAKWLMEMSQNKLVDHEELWESNIREDFFERCKKFLNKEN